jgi:hypothetical protein
VPGTVTWVHVHVKGIAFAALHLHTTGNLSAQLFRPAREVGEGRMSPDGINTILAVAVVVTLVSGPKRLKRN